MISAEQIAALKFADSFDAEVINGESIELEWEGWRIVATIHDDDHNPPPWKNEDGHGDVTEWTTRDKEPGELVLNEDGRSRRFYDFAGACRIARRDGWNAEPYDVPGETPRQRAAKAARADYERLRRWCNDDWRYVGVALQVWFEDVQLTDEYGAALWGIESDCGEYITETANELISEAMAQAVEELNRLRAKLAQIDA
jgi:hypothetical protein